MRNLIIASILLILSVTAHAQFTVLPIGGGGIAYSKIKIEKGKAAVLAGKKIQVVIVFDSVEVEEYGTEKKLISAMTDYYEQKGAGLLGTEIA